jgi:2-polyprenyl-3-methyl-5-hydroxy-6-metoxy-1,4-benzoquinol methylase
MEVKCPLCGGSPCPAIEDHLDAVTGRRWAFARCGACGAEFADPMENPGPEWYENAALYKEAACSSGVAAGVRAGIFLRLGLPREARLLDVGCGAGEFLALAAKAGYARCSGIDFSKEQVRLARELSGLTSVSVSSLDDFLPGRAGAFDFVSAFEVLEHQADPADFIEKLKKLMVPGGLLMLSMPNAARPILFGGREGWDFPPHHLTRWTAALLDRFLSARGLERVLMEDSALGEEQVYNQLLGIKVDAAVKSAVVAVKKIFFGERGAAPADQLAAAGGGAAGLLKFRAARRLPAAAFKLFFRLLLLPVSLPLLLYYLARGHRGIALVAVYRVKEDPSMRGAAGI